MSSPAFGSSLIDSPDAAARVLCDYFLTNADRGDNAANDEFVAELVCRIRANMHPATAVADADGPDPTARRRPGGIDHTDTDRQVAMSVEPPRMPGHLERGRMAAQDSRSEDGSMCTLLVVHENGGSWPSHGLDAPGGRVSQSDATALALGNLKAAK